MDLKKIYALTYMGVQFNLHLIRRVFRFFISQEDQIAKFKRNFIGDHIVELTPEERLRLPAYERCLNCGNCTAWCPVTNVIGSARFEGPREVSVSFSRGVPDFFATKDQIYLCTLCRRCETFCANSVPVAEIVRFVRAKLALVDGEYIPEPLTNIKNRILTTGLLNGGPPAAWLKHEKERAEYVLFAGCRGLADDSKSLKSLLSLLQRLRVDFSTIAENCCGGLLVEAGLDRQYEGYEKNLEAILKKGTDRVITLCPLCHRTLATHPAYRGKLKPLHYTELLGGMDFKLNLDNRPITYHDPCLMVRDLSLTDEPRGLIRRAASDLREMIEFRDSAFCCGAGGGLKEVDYESAALMARERLSQAAATGAKLLLSSCYHCSKHLKENASGNIEVLDLPVYLEQRLK